jgi:transposase
MLHAGLDLSRRKIDVCLLSEQGEYLDQLVSPPDVDALRTLARRIDEVHAEPVSAVVESMTGARLVHDTLEACGWDVEIADAQKVKGLAPWPRAASCSNVSRSQSPGGRTSPP